MPLQLDTTVNYVNGRRRTTTSQDRADVAVQHLRAHGAAAGPDQQRRGRRRCDAALTPAQGAGCTSSRSTRHGETRVRERRPGVRRPTRRCSSSGCGSTLAGEGRGPGPSGRPLALAAAAPGRLRRPRADDWQYDVLDLGADDLPVLLAGLGEEWRGFSVTMPCKQAAVDAADDWHRCRGCCTRRTRWSAPRPAGARRTPTSTGSARPWPSPGSTTHRRRRSSVPGTAAAAVVALASLGARHVEVVVREPARAGDLLRVLDVLDVASTVHRFADAVLAAPVVVSTVPSTPSRPCSGCPGGRERPSSTCSTRRGPRRSRSGWPRRAPRWSAASRCCSGRPPSRCSS